MKFRRFNISEVSAERYYRLPKFLFEGEFKNALSAEAKVLYALLRDRFNLSLKNGWTNDKGEVYLIYTREEMCDMIGCGAQKIRRLVKELKAVGLFEEEQLGQNMPNHIFLTYLDIDSKHPSSADVDTSADKEAEYEKSARKAPAYADCRKSTVHKSTDDNSLDFSKKSKPSKIQKIGQSKINTPDSRKSTPNKTDNNKLFLYNKSINQNSNNNYIKALKETKEQIEYDILKQEFPSSPFTPDTVDAIAEIMTDIRISEMPYIQIGHTKHSTESFKAKLAELDGSAVSYIITRFKELLTPPTNPRAYITAMLYNAKADNALALDL